MTSLKAIADALSRKQAVIEELAKAKIRKDNELTELQAKHKHLTDLVVSDTQATEIIKFIFDKVSERGFKFLEQLATQALQVVFVDENYSFEIKPGSRGAEKTVDFLVNDGTNSYPLSETGGGVQVLISFVFRIYYILKVGLRRVVFMDESFSQLSPQYLDTLLTFLNTLVEKFGFVFLWISHSPYLEGRVDKFYEMRKGVLYEK